MGRWSLFEACGEERPATARTYASFQMSDEEKPVTKAELESVLKDLKNFILEREIVAMRWVLGIQITYFFGTLAAVWFLITHH